jgi:type II secretory pathway component PulF
MPSFRWHGITLEGTNRSGTQEAYSVHDLTVKLLAQDIALLRATLKSPAPWYKPVKRAHLIELFYQLSTLVQAGIFIDRALQTVQPHITNSSLRCAVHDIVTQVNHGIPLATAFGAYPSIFDPLLIQALHAGHQSGAIVPAVAMITDYLMLMQDFYKKLRAALFLPILTLFFFAAVSVTIIMVILPQFAHMFTVAHKAVPTITQVLLGVNYFLRSTYGVLLMGILLTMLTAVYAAIRTGNARLNAWLFHIPFVGSYVKDSTLLFFFQALGMLVNAGMPIVPALKTAQNTLRAGEFKDALAGVIQQISSGRSLEDALTNMPHFIIAPQVVSLIAVGQESGALGPMLNAGARWYHARITKRLALISTIVQPVLMMVLGLLVVALILAVYLPILDFSYAIG